MAQSFAPEGKVRNLMEVAGVHQVMLEVRVAEISKNDIKRLGFNFSYFDGSNFVVSLLGGLTNLNEISASGVGSFGLSPNVTALFRFGDNVSWTGMIDALKEDGIIKILAKPTLTTMSGQNANFLAGGEFPIPVPQGLNGTISIEYKSYGVGLNFLPTVLSPDRINIRVSPDVSELDYRNAVKIGGYVVPGITVRRASTSVELGDGQSFAIAGLLRDYSTEDISKFPLLGIYPFSACFFEAVLSRKMKQNWSLWSLPGWLNPLMRKNNLCLRIIISNLDLWIWRSLSWAPESDMVVQPQTVEPWTESSDTQRPKHNALSYKPL